MVVEGRRRFKTAKCNGERAATGTKHDGLSSITHLISKDYRYVPFPLNIGGPEITVTYM